MMNEPVTTIMSTKLITIHPEDSLQKVQELFSKYRIHHLPVVENDNKLVGLITTYDLFKLGKGHYDYPTIKVSDVMSKKIAKLEPSSKVGTACEVFLENLFHALPVVKDGKLVGLVTTFDVLKYTHKKEYPNQEILSSLIRSGGVNS